MGFSPITANTKTFNGRSPGKYVESNTGFADPLNEIRIRPSTAVRKNGSVDVSLTRVLEKEDTANDSYGSAVVTLSVSLPKGDLFTATEMDDMVSDIAEFITPDTLGRMLQGES